MIYSEFIKFMISPNLLDELYSTLNINTQSEALLIYMHDAVSVNAEVHIMEIEETGDEIEYEKDGIKYVQFFPVKHAIDLIKYDLQLLDNGCSDLEIGQRLLEYRLNDA